MAFIEKVPKKLVNSQGKYKMSNKYVGDVAAVQHALAYIQR